MITQERLKELFYYHPESGDFVLLIYRGGHLRVGQQAGTLNQDGYVRIKADGVKYFAHRLAWFYVHGVWPDDEIDHKNCIRFGNEIKNLREASREGNTRNATVKRTSVTGMKGVSQRKKRFRAKILVAGCQKHLGYFDTIEEAGAAYAAAAKQHHGEFARVG